MIGVQASAPFGRRTLVAFGLAALAMGALSVQAAQAAHVKVPKLTGRVVADGIPGAGAISVVGVFHPGGPINDLPAFRASTEPRAILDPERILVASTSNFGAPQTKAGTPSGAILSIDPRAAKAISVPAKFAALGGQSRAVNGRVMLFSASSPPFGNAIHNANAVTADYPSLSNPTGISLNNAFGRIWITSMPAGPSGAGIHSILDPDGCPLNNAPDKTAGGVFTGTLTNRQPQIVPGELTSAVLATALLGRSPDGGGRAVFASLQADGSLAQIHAEQGVDGLAQAGTVTPRNSATSTRRAGMVFNWVPDRVLYVADPVANAIVVLSLQADAKTFSVTKTSRLTSASLNEPVDLAPAIVEGASAIFSSNTTLAGGADIYVANRGNGTIVRLKQNGDVVAIRRVSLPHIGLIGAGKLNGIATSSDAQKIWITVNVPLRGHPQGSVIELPAFGGMDASPH